MDIETIERTLEAERKETFLRDVEEDKEFSETERLRRLIKEAEQKGIDVEKKVTYNLRSGHVEFMSEKKIYVGIVRYYRTFRGRVEFRIDDNVKAEYAAVIAEALPEVAKTIKSLERRF